MSDRCLICGAVLSENNITGIGRECLAALNKAKSTIFFNNKEYSFKYNYLIEVEVVKNTFLTMFETVNFRSTFKKSFFESMKNAEHVSRKQLDVMRDMIGYKDVIAYNDMLKDIRTKKDEYKECICSDISVTREQVEIARNIIKNKS